MHLAALSKENNYSIRRFRATAQDMGHKWTRIDPTKVDLVLGAKGGHVLWSNGKPIPGIDVALTRRGSAIGDLEITVVNHLEHSGVPVLNGTYGMLVSRDKFWSLRRLHDRGIPVPASVVLHRADAKSLERAYKVVGEPPVVLKMLRGMRGVGVMVAETRQSVRSILDTFRARDESVLMQEFIAESSGTDVRVLVVGGKVVTAMKRQAPLGEFRSNIHRGGVGSLFKPDAAARRMAVDAAKYIGLDIAGVDLIYADEGPRVMEVNSSPGFEGLEKATGQDIARIILDHAINIAEGKVKPMARRLKVSDVMGGEKKVPIDPSRT